MTRLAVEPLSYSTESPKTAVPPVSWHRRVLYPARSGHQPPRVLHAAASSTLDPFILDLIALVCREHVLTWYSNISRDPDRAFIQQITALLVHVIQALEVRLAQTDLVALIVIDLPTLFEQHVRDFDEAVYKSRSAVAHNLTRDNVFDLLQPHIAISTSKIDGEMETTVDKTYLRALVDNLLTLLLPPHDLKSDTERTIVREIMVNILLGSVFTRVAQPWFWHSLIIKLVDPRSTTLEPGKSTQDASDKRTGYISNPHGSSFQPMDGLLAALSSALVAMTAVTQSLSALYHAAVLTTPPSHALEAPGLIFDPFTSFVLALLPASTFLLQVVHFITMPLALCSSFMTALVYHVVSHRLLTVNFAKLVLENATNSLFPNGHPPPKEPDPTVEQQVELERRCIDAVARGLPGWLVKVLAMTGTTEDAQHELAQHLLRPLSSHTANVHLMMLVIDLVVQKLFPELTELVDE
ncbi:hypothetical protein OIO90_001998 [Microbotryomycetes sp. JL221]|nr:hypothetical protein OIO90_001998 [Microbotryomycetes sp. JL221]